MRTIYLLLLFAVLIFSCRIREKEVKACFSCNLHGGDSCAMTDYLERLVTDTAHSSNTAVFYRCGAGKLVSVRFSYSGMAIIDSALINIYSDNSAYYSFPLQTTASPDSTLAKQYQKSGYLELPLSTGVVFKDSCTVIFLLHSKAIKRGSTFVNAGFKNISLQWTPQNEQKDDSK